MTAIYFKNKQLNLLCVLLLTLASCHQQKKYSWIPTECTPENYPIQIYSGDLFYGSDRRIYIPARSVVNNGWGQEGSVDVAGDEYKEAPDSLQISWYSFVENKYYEGLFHLNYHLIDSLFKAGFQTNHGHVTYNTVKVGVAPGGVVVVWVDGDRFQTEVGRYQAKETQEFNWKQKFPELRGTFEEYRKAVIKGMSQKVQQQIAAHQITYGLWDKWRQRHPWRPIFKVPGGYEVEVSYFNKDREDLLPPQLSPVRYRPLAVPERMDILWLDDKKAHMVTTVTFNEEEAYQLFGKVKPGQKADLTVELNAAASSMTIVLKFDGEELPFLKHELATVTTDQ
jgi:hypothetical protein